MKGRGVVGFMDKLKGLTKGRERQISQGVDKAGDFINKQTKGKYSSQIRSAENKVDDLLETDQDGAAASTPPPAGTSTAPPPPSGTPPAAPSAGPPAAHTEPPAEPGRPTG